MFVEAAVVQQDSAAEIHTLCRGRDEIAENIMAGYRIESGARSSQYFIGT
jgi:hypothetical protein